MKTFTFSLLALAAFAARSADFVYEGRWLKNGQVTAGQRTSCSMIAYADPEAKTKLAERDDLSFRTDSDGYFAVSATFSLSQEVVYLTIRPKGENAVMPLQKAAPCPYAIVADSVEAVTNASGVVTAGTLSAGNLAVSGNLAVGNLTLSKVQLSATDVVVSNATLSSCTLGDGSAMQYLNPRSSSWRPAVTYDSFEADLVARVKNFPSQGGVMDFPEYTFEGDGFVQIFARGVVQYPLSNLNSQRPFLNVTLADVKILEGVRLEDGVNGVQRLMTYPYRDGDVLKLGLPCYNHGTASSPVYNYTEAKIKFIKFGLD